MTSFLHIAARKPSPGIWTNPFCTALRDIGELTIIENGESLSEAERAALIRQHHILITGWESSPVPVDIAADRGKLEYICNVTGSLRWFIPLEVIERGIPVTNWGDAPAHGIAEGAMALLLATLKDLHKQTRLIEQDGWALDAHTSGGSIDGLHVGLYGLGVIGRRFVELIRPFGPVLRVFDPYVTDLPEECQRVDSLDALFSQSEAIVLMAGLSDETRNSVTAELLAKLPKYGVVINTARGGIIDQDALFAELASGRLRAGLDVLEPDRLPDHHPARQWDNVIFTAHAVHRGWPDDHQPPTKLSLMHRYALENIRHHLAGEPLRFLMDRDRYLRST